MQWNVKKCAEVFDQMARHIFHERRSSSLSRVSQAIFGSKSFFGKLQKWILWLLHDGCYDGHVFDMTLRETFGCDNRIFDTLKVENDSTMYSKVKMGVVATSIAKETWSFIFGNFNPAKMSGENCGQLRPIQHCHPLLVDTNSRIRDHPACKCGPGTFHLGSVGTLKHFAKSNANRFHAVQEPQQPHLRDFPFPVIIYVELY